MGWLGTIALNAPLGIGAYFAARHGLRQPPGLPRALAAAVLAWAWATLGVLVLGTLGRLELVPLAAWSIAGGVIGAATIRSRSEDERPTPKPSDWCASATWAIGLVLVAAIPIATSSLLLPVKVVSDGPIYHLYFAVRWWKAGRLFLVPTPFGETAAPYFPAGGDVWFTWLLTGWGGDRLARIGQAPFWLLAGAAAFGLARRLGATTPSAIIATCWFVTNVPMLLFSFEANVDTVFAAGYLLAAYFLSRFAIDEGGWPALLLAGLAAGGAWGSKPTATVFVPPLLGLGLVLVLWRGRRRLAEAAALVGGTILMSGYWFGRNLVLTGNPLYPLHIEAFGRVWLSGWFSRSAMKYSRFHIPADNLAAFADIVMTVFDPRLMPVWLAAILGAWTWGRRARPWAGWDWACSALAVANVAAYWLFIPYRTQQRFMIHAMGLAVVPLALTIDRGRPLRWVAVGLLAVHLLTPHTWPFGAPLTDWLWEASKLIPTVPRGPINVPINLEQWYVMTSTPAGVGYLAGMAALAAGAVPVAWAWGRAARRNSSRRTGLAMGLTALLVLASVWTLGLGVKSGASRFPPFADYYRGWHVLDSMTRRAPRRIAYAGTNLPFYLMMPELRNEVRYVNIDAHRGWLLHDYHRDARAGGEAPWDTPRPGWDRIRPDFDAWLANLRAERIELLVVARSNPEDGRFNVANDRGFPIEAVWAERHPELFEPVYGAAEGDPLFHIYRFRSEKIGDSATDRASARH